MGIKGLKTFLKNNIPNNKGIQKIPLLKYSGKTIALDFTNFLYKFLLISDLSDNYLLEFINIIHKFSKYGIKLIFIFDGKPVDEKQKTIDRRKTIRKLAKEQYEEICSDKDNNKNDIIHDEETIIAKNIKISKLHKKSISIKFEHIINCKYLFDLMGIEWHHRKYIEADILFKYLFDKNIIDACYSADMDILLYECPILLSDLDFHNDEIYEYNYTKILEYLNLSNMQLLNACVASGTDFNYPLINCKIEDNIELIRKYNIIENIINNLETINLHRLSKIKIPVYFNYEVSIKIYKTNLSIEAQIEISNQNMIYKKNLSNNSIKKNIVSNLDKIILKIKSMYAPVKFVYKIQEFCYYKYGFKP